MSLLLNNRRLNLKFNELLFYTEGLITILEIITPFKKSCMWCRQALHPVTA